MMEQAANDGLDSIPGEEQENYRFHVRTTDDLRQFARDFAVRLGVEPEIGKETEAVATFIEDLRNIPAVVAVALVSYMEPQLSTSFLNRVFVQFDNHTDVDGTLDAIGNADANLWRGLSRIMPHGGLKFIHIELVGLELAERQLIERLRSSNTERLLSIFTFERP